MRLFLLFFTLLTASPGYAQDLGFEKAAVYGQGYPQFAEFLKAISWVESKHDADLPPTRCEFKNKRGEIIVSHDFGHMQINDYFWKAAIDKIDKRLWSKMVKDPKTCTKIGAWILSQELARHGNIWDAVAAYNTGHPINLAACNGNVKRFERAKAYAFKVYNRLVENNQLHPRNYPPLALKQGKGTAPVSTPGGVDNALPMRRINTANYRSNGTWRQVN